MKTFIAMTAFAFVLSVGAALPARAQSNYCKMIGCVQCPAGTCANSGRPWAKKLEFCSAKKCQVPAKGSR